MAGRKPNASKPEPKPAIANPDAAEAAEPAAEKRRTIRSICEEGLLAGVPYRVRCRDVGRPRSRRSVRPCRVLLVCGKDRRYVAREGSLILFCKEAAFSIIDHQRPDGANNRGREIFPGHGRDPFGEPIYYAYYTSRY